LEPGYRKVELGLAEVDYKIGVRFFEAKSLEKARTYLNESAQFDASRGEPHYYMGLIHRNWKEDEKALPMFETALSRGAFVTESRFEAGEILFLQQEWNRSIDYLDAVAQVSPDYRSDKVKSYLRESWWKLAMFDVQSKQWATAEGKLKKVMKYPPDLPATHYYLGFVALKQTHYDTAVAELEPTLKKQPNDIDTKKALAEAHFQLGLAAYSAQHFTDAHSSFARANQVDPTNEEIQYQLARTRVALQRYPEAIPVLEKLASREPPFRESPDDLAKAYGGYGEQLLDKGNKPQARTYFEKALKLNPQEMSALYGSGSIALSEKRYEEAAKALQAVHDRDQDYRRSYALLLDAYWNLGLKAYDKKDNQSARGYFQQVVDLDPNHGEALYYLGDIEVNAKNYDVAKSYFERAINRKTKLVEAHYGLGTVLYDQQQYGEAVEHFEEASKLNPTYKNVDSYLRRAIYNEADRLFREGNSSEAVVYYIRYFALEPKNPEIALRIADISEKAGFNDQAMEWYDKAIPIMKSDPDPVRFKLAMLAFQAKQYERALQTAGRMKSPDARELKGTIYIAMGKRDRQAGDLKESMVNFKLAMALMPDNADLLFEYGQLRLTMNDVAEAAVFLRRAVDKNPELPKGKEILADVYRKLGAEAFAKERLDEADRNFKTSIIYAPSIEANYNIGVIAFLKKDFETAYSLFQKVEGENPRYQANANYLKDTVCKLGSDALARNEYEKAKGLISTCAKYNPSDRTLRYQLALLSFIHQIFEEARQRFKDIFLNSASSFPEAEGYLVDSLYALENAAFTQGDFERAQKYSEEILERTPNSYRAHFARSRSLEKLGNLNEAEKEVRTTLGTRPGLAEAVEALQRIQAAKAASSAVTAPTSPAAPQ
jgi:tetratricopeptide (TPR) repeat protein